MKALKVLLLIVVLLLVIVVGGAVAFVSFADPNDFKDLIADKVRAATGRELTLSGPLEWGFYPKLRLRAGPLTLGNAAGFGEEPFFAADEIKVAVATLPLLSRRLEMDTVVLHGIAVNLERDAAGVSNWDDLAGGGEAEQHEGDGLAAIILGGVDVRDARVSYRDAVSGQEVTVSGINAATGALTFGEPVDFELALTAVANQPALDSDVKLTGTVSYNLDDEHYVVSPLALNTVLRGDHLPGGSATIDFGAAVDINLEDETVAVTGLALEGLGTSVSGSFNARDIEDERPSASGELMVRGKDLAALFNAFELPVGKQLKGIGDRTFNFDVAFDADMDSGKVVVSKLDGAALGATLGGSFNATEANTDKPRANGSISAAGPDLPTLLAVLGQLQGADAETLASLDGALAGAKDKSFSIKADLDANLAEGKASLPTLEAKLLGNTISGRVDATNAASEKLAVTGTLDASGPDFPTLLTVIARLQGADAATIKSLGTALKSAADKSFKVNVDIDADLGKGTAALPRLEAKLLGNAITGQLAARNINAEKPAAKGSLTASGADLPSLLAIASQFQADGKATREMAAALAKEKNKAFRIEAAFDSDLGAGRIDLDKLSADLLGLEVRGGLKGEGVDFEKGKGRLDGRITVTSGDLGTLLRSRGQADLAKSLKTLDLEAGIKGSLDDLTIAPLKLATLVSSPEVGKPVKLEVAAGSARANLDADTLVVKDLSVTGLGLNAKANIDAQKISSEPTFSGKLEVPAFNLRKLLASLNKPSKAADPKAMTSVALSTRFTGSGSSVKLDDLAIVLDQTNIKGNINVRDFEGPDLGFGIGVDQINADRYMEPAPKGKARAATPETAAAGAAAELPVETLRALKIKGDLLVGKLVLSGATLVNIKFSIDANGGLIKLQPIAADLYQGKYGGAITLNARGKNPVVNLQTKLAGVNVEPLIVDTTGNNMLAGQVSFDAALKLIGNNPDAMKKSLTGNGSFSTRNGVFRGVDAAATLRAVEQMIECKCPVPLPKGGETRFASLGGTLKANKGIVRVNDLLMTGDGFTITGKGTLANLRDDSVKYDLELAVPEQAKQAGVSNYNLGGYAVPIKCRGQLESPNCRPDEGRILKQLVQNAAQEKVQEAIGDKLKDAVGGEAGEALKKLFKF